MKQGIEIFLGPTINDWAFIEAVDRAQAEQLQLKSQEIVPTRRVVKTEEGHIIRVFATE